MEDVVKRGLHGPARHDLRMIRQGQIELVVADRVRQSGEGHYFAIERGGVTRNPAVQERRTELVVRPLRQHARKHDAAIPVELNRIAIGSTYAGAAEYADAAVGIATGGADKLRLDPAENGPGAAPARRASPPRGEGPR